MGYKYDKKKVLEAQKSIMEKIKSSLENEIDRVTTALVSINANIAKEQD